MISTQVLRLVSAAIDRQEEKFGKEPLASPWEAAAILGEEYGEFCRAVNQQNVAEADKEAVQIIAVSIAYLMGTLHYGKQA